MQATLTIRPHRVAKVLPHELYYACSLKCELRWTLLSYVLNTTKVNIMNAFYGLPLKCKIGDCQAVIFNSNPDAIN